MKKILLVGLLSLISTSIYAQGVAQIGPQGAQPVRCVNSAGTAFESCAGSGSATDTDDGTVAGAQVGSVNISLSYFWTGSSWERLFGDSDGLKIQCTTGCGAGTQDADDASVAAGQTTGLNIGLTHFYNGSAWVRWTGTISTVSTVTAVTTVTNPVTVTDGSGALNVICDSGCSGGTTDADDASIATGQTTGIELGLTQVYDGSVWRRLTFGTAGTASAQVFTIQGIASMTPILATVSDGSGALNVIVDSITAGNNNIGDVDVASIAAGDNNIGNVDVVTMPTVTVTDGAGAMNVIIDSGTTAVTASNLDVQIGGSDIVAVSQSGTWDEVGINDSGNSITVDASNLDVQSGGGDLVLDATVTTIFGADAIFGTAGTADSDVLTIQGVASMTPVLTNPGTAANVAIYVEDAGETAAGNLSMSGTVRRDTAASSAGATGDNATLNTDASGLLWVRSIDPCSSGAKSYFTVNIATATTVEIANSVASQYFYICSINLVTAASNNVVIAEDDTDGCGSISAGVTGGTTAATGWNFAANGGITIGNGMGSVGKTTTAARYFCILTSAATQLSGVISYISAP